MSIRTERLAAQLRIDLADVLREGYQPTGTFVSVTRVVVTPDLSLAKVYLSVFAPGRDLTPIFERIDQHQDEIRHQLAMRIRHQVRRVPQLIFFMDDTAEHADRIEKLFRKVNEEREETGGDESGPE